jgi:hypothetical protein
MRLMELSVQLDEWRVPVSNENVRANGNPGHEGIWDPKSGHMPSPVRQLSWVLARTVYLVGWEVQWKLTVKEKG